MLRRGIQVLLAMRARSAARSLWVEAGTRRERRSTRSASPSLSQ
jgi:hypothetical protein